MSTDKGPVRILCLDDEPSPLASYKYILEPQGYEVLTARNSVEALEIMLKEPVDLLIQDLARPEMFGIDLYRLMKATKRLEHIPVVNISGSPECRKRFLDRYPNTAVVLAKPFTVEVVLDVVRKALQSAADKRGDIACPS